MRWSLAALALVLGGCPGDDGEDPTSGTGGTHDTHDTHDDHDHGTETEGHGSSSSHGETDMGTTSGTSGTDDGETTDGDDATTEGTESGDTTTGVTDEPGPDLRDAGPFAVETSSGTASLPGCSMGYDIYSPAGGGDAPVVVLAHGFQGNRGTMADWADHWASWGLTVVTPDLCHATVFNADHAQNGADLQALVQDLNLGSVIYAGYSAGGLASVLAAAGDDQALSLLGLDMVDSDGLGAAAAASVTATAFDIVGEPSQCNTTNNGVAVFQAAGGQALRISGSDHCDFQSPADFLCGVTCPGGAGQFDDAEIAAAVRGLSTAVVVWQTGLEPTGAQWWTPGSHYYDELSALGIVQQP